MCFLSNISTSKATSQIFKIYCQKIQRRLIIIISSMQQPLGKAIGNLIEIKDVIDFLSGNDNKYSDIKKLIYKFTIKILSETKKNISSSVAKEKIDFVIESKRALNKFYLWIKKQKVLDLTQINKLPFNPI